jgi:hypothetical protein
MMAITTSSSTNVNPRLEHFRDVRIFIAVNSMDDGNAVTRRTNGLGEVNCSGTPRRRYTATQSLDEKSKRCKFIKALLRRGTSLNDAIDDFRRHSLRMGRPGTVFSDPISR